MRCSGYFFSSLAISILSWAFIHPSIASARDLYRPWSPSLPFQIPQYTARSPDERQLLTKIRDGIVQYIWGSPSIRQSVHGNARSKLCKSSSLSTPPPPVLARYGEDVVLRFKIKSPEESKALAVATNALFLDVWEFNSEWADIRLAKDVVPSLLGLLPSSLQHAHTPLMHDLAQTIYESYPLPPSADGSSHSPTESHRSFGPSLRMSPNENNIFFQEYQPLSVIVPWMRLLQSLFPSHVRMINIGTSYEGRDIPALRVGVHPTNSETPSGPRKSIVISAGSHAREWISTSTVNYVAYSMITAYGKSQWITKIVEEFDWIFIPTINPDGYVYTWENDRLWRKNRQPTNLRFCKGLDIDRAYGFEWDGEASKTNPCSESFSGEGPFQAVESRRLANWARNETENNNVELVGFLDFHSYSQQVLYPYSYSCTSAPPSLENLEELALGLAKAIRYSTGETYGVTSACEGSVTMKQKDKKKSEAWPRIETGGGSALDWFYHEMKLKYAYQIKLRDTGSYGFLLPSKNIVPTGKEAFSAVMYFGKYLLGNKGIELDGEFVGFEADQTTLSSPEFAKTSNVQGTPQGDEYDLMDDVIDDEEPEDLNWELRKR